MSINILKQGWIELSLEEVCSQIVGGGTPSTKIIQYWQGSIPWITSADILDIKTVLPKKYITVDAIKNSATNIVPKGTIIVVTRVSLGKIAIAPFDLCFSQDNQGLIFYDNIVDANYALFYLYIAVFSFKYSGRGTTINGVTKNQLKNLFFRFPPLPEQRAIVTKIEQLFSELDSGVENLKKAQAQLKVYRQAVLKWAFEGKLTEEWRKKQKDLPTAETLLAQIKTEREKQAEKSNKKLKPIAPISEEELPKLPVLPQNWIWVRLDNLGSLGRGKSKHRPRNDKKLFGGKYPFIQTGEVKAAGYFIQSFENTYSEFGLSQSKLWPIGTLCITIAANIAETAFLGIDACFPDSIVGFIGNERIISSKFIFYFFKGNQNKLEAFAPATAQKNINLKTLEILIIPYCSLIEQSQIVQEIEDRLSVCDKMEETIAQSLQKAESLRQSILKKAFEGKLLTTTELEEVRKAPDWEPAEKLLQRIKTGKESQKTGKIK